MADNVTLDFDEWHEHARWWESEGPRVREQLGVDEATLAQARSMFGKIGSSTVGAAFQDVLRARAQAGQVLGAYCEGVASHIRQNVTSYADTEAASQRTLST
ncbi:MULTISPECIES: hypothetical protein [Mycobacterium]|uniref:hypothetical protein n=1 Tax=Mycobacterium TaxID=1763 RepID=UPI0005F00357|nr:MULTISPECIES: hypothetical protein [Mycobacterium]MCV7034901.1 hypothetical protein [Mycobacterium heckeshornense]